MCCRPMYSIRYWYFALESGATIQALAICPAHPFSFLFLLSCPCKFQDKGSALYATRTLHVLFCSGRHPAVSTVNCIAVNDKTETKTSWPLRVASDFVRQAAENCSLLSYSRSRLLRLSRSESEPCRFLQLHINRN